MADTANSNLWEREGKRLAQQRRTDTLKRLAIGAIVVLIGVGAALLLQPR